MQPASGFGRSPVDKRPLFVADNDFREALAIDLGDHDLGADAGVVMDQVRDEFCHPAGAAGFHFIPIEHRRIVDSGIAAGAVGFGCMCPMALAGDDILDAIPIDVGKIQSMQHAV
jgi:hypothetical protein